jgi:hypothetical protein
MAKEGFLVLSEIGFWSVTYGKLCHLSELETLVKKVKLSLYRPGQALGVPRG